MSQFDYKEQLYCVVNTTKLSLHKYLLNRPKNKTATIWMWIS